MRDNKRAREFLHEARIHRASVVHFEKMAETAERAAGEMVEVPLPGAIVRRDGKLFRVVDQHGSPRLDSLSNAGLIELGSDVPLVWLDFEILQDGDSNEAGDGMLSRHRMGDSPHGGMVLGEEKVPRGEVDEALMAELKEGMAKSIREAGESTVLRQNGWCLETAGWTKDGLLLRRNGGGWILKPPGKCGTYLCSTLELAFEVVDKRQAKEQACGDCPVGGRDGGGPHCPNTEKCDREAAEGVAVMDEETSATTGPPVPEGWVHAGSPKHPAVTVVTPFVSTETSRTGMVLTSDGSIDGGRGGGAVADWPGWVFANTETHGEHMARDGWAVSRRQGAWCSFRPGEMGGKKHATRELALHCAEAWIATKVGHVCSGTFGCTTTVVADGGWCPVCTRRPEEEDKASQ